MAKFLLGFMGAGKSTLAAVLDADFIDMDDLLVERLGMPIVQYFEEYGEVAFRKEETALLEELLEVDGWVSTGGGIVTRAENRLLLQKSEECIYLKADFELLYQRMITDTQHVRPLFLQHTKDSLQDLFLERESWYEEVASHIIEVADQTPEELAEDVRCRLPI